MVQTCTHNQNLRTIQSAHIGATLLVNQTLRFITCLWYTNNTLHHVWSLCKWLNCVLCACQTCPIHQGNSANIVMMLFRSTHYHVVSWHNMLCNCVELSIHMDVQCVKHSLNECVNHSTCQFISSFRHVMHYNPCICMWICMGTMSVCMFTYV